MGLVRLGISNPAGTTPTKIFTAGDPYLISIIAANKSTSLSAKIRIWVQPSGSSTPSEYAYMVYDLPLDASNTYESFRFAINATDDVYVQADTANVSFQAYGLVQYDVKLGAGVVSWSATAPTNPINGMIWVDSDGTVFGSSAKPIYIYDASTLSWVSTAASALDTSANYAFSGTVSIGNVSSTEISYLDGVTSSIQTQFGNVSSQITAFSTDFQNVMAQRMFG